MLTLDYYFTLISPFSFMGHQRLRAIVEPYDIQLNYKPLRLGQLFEQTGGLPPAKRHPSRQTWRFSELERWSKHLATPIVLRPRHFPANDAVANAIVGLLGQDDTKRAGELAQAFHALVWQDEGDIADEAAVAQVLTRFDLPADDWLERAKGAGAALLDANTQEALERGVFGAPSYILGQELFWGQDRLDFLQEAVQRAVSNSLAHRVSQTNSAS